MATAILTLLVGATLSNSAQGATGCSLRNPDQDIQRFFPQVTDYVVNYISFQNQSPSAHSSLETLLGSALDPIYETSDVPYTLYTVYGSGETLGYVFGTNQRGKYSNIQVIAIVDANLDLQEVYLQTLRSPAYEDFSSPLFLDALARLELDDFSSMAGCYRDSECGGVSVTDPSAGKEPEDYRHILRALSKLHGVQTLLLHPGESVTLPSTHAQAEWIGNHQGIDLSRRIEDAPEFVPLNEAKLDPGASVVAWRHREGLRVYPVNLLQHSPVVHDMVLGQKIAVTWSPTSNTATIFGLAPESPGFQPSGDLLFESRVLVDRESGSQWSPLSGMALYGPAAGSHAQALAAAHVLPRGAIIDKTAEVWVSNETTPSSLFTASQSEPVLMLQGRGETPAWRLSTIRQEGLIHQKLGGAPILLAAAGDSAVAWGRDIGERVLSFEPCPGGGICDRETGSRFSLASGSAVEGPLKGQFLPAVISVRSSKNAWASVFPGERLDGQRE